MGSISKTIDKVRTLINKPRKQNLLLQNNTTWNILCSSFDTIEDASSAIDAYLLSTKNKYEINFSYIIIYGVMQAMFLQQDAIKNIASSLGKNIEFDNELKRIREIRNNCIGHPVREFKGDYKSFNYIQQFGMTHISFRLVSYYPNKSDPTFIEINIPELIKIQTGTVNELLNELVKFIEEEEKKHKEEFMDKNLKDYFTHFSYNIGKVYECIYNKDYKSMSFINFKEIKQNIEDVKIELAKRSLLNNLPGIDYNLSEINYPINILYQYFEDEKNMNDDELNIYIYFLQKKVEELIEMFEEVDSEYK